MPFASISIRLPVRFVALLLAVLLPIKAVAATFVLVVGMPGHAHAGAAAVSQEHVHCLMLAQDERGHAPAADHAVDHADNAPIHDHPCPHLGMASIPPSVSIVATEFEQHRAPACNALHFTSITLDVPSPPPTGFSA